MTPELQTLINKQRSDQPLTQDEERTYRKLHEERTASYVKTHPPRISTGLIPLNDLGKGMYKEHQGGLYPSGENEPPRAHREAGLRIAESIVPLEAEGRPSRDGKIVLLSLGMSNTMLEFTEFIKMTRGDRRLNEQLVLVNGSQGGQDASKTSDPTAPYWTLVDERLAAAKVTSKQVQAVWFKQAIIGPRQPFPHEAKRLQGYATSILHIAHQRYPNLKIVYLSSRIYAGYAKTGLNPEPFAYEDGFGIKWLIADQIAGKPELNYDPAKGPVRSPWIAWGPYLWADGINARSDGLAYSQDDLVPDDGTHPNPGAKKKVSTLLLNFLINDKTALGWFLRRN
jgi:hypothetical protein